MEWISVDDRLPAKRPFRFESCIVAKENGVVMEAIYNTKTDTFMGLDFNPLNHKAVCWMPLPKPPEDV